MSHIYGLLPKRATANKQNFTAIIFRNLTRTVRPPQMNEQRIGCNCGYRITSAGGTLPEAPQA